MRMRELDGRVAVVHLMVVWCEFLEMWISGGQKERILDAFEARGGVVK